MLQTPYLTDHQMKNETRTDLSVFRSKKTALILIQSKRSEAITLNMPG